jgi:hypothetical protein
MREAIHEYFGQRIVASRRTLRELFRRGRISLVIALAFLTASVAVGDAVAGYLGDGRLGEVIREGFLIGGWVAMWRPLEVFLYDWWPIRADGRLLQRLSTIPVRIEYKWKVSADAWRSDWPEVPAGDIERKASSRSRSKTSESVRTARIVTQTCGHFRGSSSRRFLHPRLERLVQGLESFPCATIEVLAQQRNQIPVKRSPWMKRVRRPWSSGSILKKCSPSRMPGSTTRPSHRSSSSGTARRTRGRVRSGGPI